MCTTARMTYQLTYRALRQFANGRISHHPIETMKQMETVVPFSVCSHTHDVMMKANRSFNQRDEKPAGVHEPDLIHWNMWYPMYMKPSTETSNLRYVDYKTIHTRLHTLRLETWAKGANHSWMNNHLKLMDAKARAIKATQDLPLFA